MTDAVLGEQTQQVTDSQQTALLGDQVAEGATEQQSTTEQTTQQADNTQEQGQEGQKPEGENKQEGAPEKYEFKAPEGKEFDAHVLNAFSEAAKEANLSQDAAQKILDKVAPEIAAQQEKAIADVQKGWKEALPSDKEFGGNDYKNNLAVANEGLTKFGSTELISLLDQTGLKNHPEVVRLFYRVGKSVSNDKLHVGDTGKPVNTQENKLAALYPTSVKE